MFLLTDFLKILTDNGIFQKQFRNISEKVSTKESPKWFTESSLKNFRHISVKVYFKNFTFNGRFPECFKNIPEIASDECISEMFLWMLPE